MNAANRVDTGDHTTIHDIRDIAPTGRCADGPGTAGRRRERIRRVVFFVSAAVLSLLCGSTFTGVTVLTIGLWFANRNHDTTPVTDLGFFALGAVITSGLVIQLWAPERHITGLQHAVIGLLALGGAGLIGDRVEPLTGAIILLGANALLVALHPARRGFFALSAHPNVALLALALLAALPAAVYAASMLVQARQAGPSCFFGRCAYGDRFAEMAALAIATVAIGLLAACRSEGRRGGAWSAGAAAVLMGVVSIVWPNLPGSLGLAAGGVAILWGILFVAVAEWGSRGAGEPESARQARTLMTTDRV